MSKVGSQSSCVRVSRLLPALLAAASVAGIGAATAAPASAAMVEAQASHPVEFEVFLPLRNAAELDALLKDQQTVGSPSYHQWLTPAQFSQRFGPTSASIARVQAALASSGLKVTAIHSRSLHVAGTAAAVNRTFGARLMTTTTANGAERLVAAGAITLPAALQAEQAVIVHFSGRPTLQPQSVRLAGEVPDARFLSYGNYYWTDLKQAYDYPSYLSKAKGKTLDGTGVSVAILMSNDVLDSDIQASFDHEHFTDITGKPAPHISRFPINGGAPFDVNASFEASLDTQQVLAGAPGASVTLVNIPDLSDDNVIDGYLSIVEFNAWDIVNSSFGGCELTYSAKYNGGTSFYGVLDTFSTLFKQGNAQGITFVASSGDQGGVGCPDATYFAGGTSPQFVKGVSWPAVDPGVTGVGGGNLITTEPPNPQTTPPTLTSKYKSENGFGDPEIPYDIYGIGTNVSGGYWGAGGGVSDHFAKPLYQTLVNTGSNTKRTVPDIGMLVGGCPSGIAQLPCGPKRSFAIVFDGGHRFGVIGTSIASPELVGALALYAQREGHRLGNINPYLYTVAAVQNASTGNQPPAHAYHRNMPGFDGAYTTDFPKKYNYIFGNGTPDVRFLFGMKNLAPAGDPQTPSNP